MIASPVDASDDGLRSASTREGVRPWPDLPTGTPKCNRPPELLRLRVCELIFSASRGLSALRDCGLLGEAAGSIDSVFASAACVLTVR
jgi:hypothetical protein